MAYMQNGLFYCFSLEGTSMDHTPVQENTNTQSLSDWYILYQCIVTSYIYIYI